MSTESLAGIWTFLCFPLDSAGITELTQAAFVRNCDSAFYNPINFTKLICFQKNTGLRRMMIDALCIIQMKGVGSDVRALLDDALVYNAQVKG